MIKTVFWVIILSVIIIVNVLIILYKKNNKSGKDTPSYKFKETKDMNEIYIYEETKDKNEIYIYKGNKKFGKFRIAKFNEEIINWTVIDPKNGYFTNEYDIITILNKYYPRR